MAGESKCPFNHHVAGGGRTNKDWWPNHLRVELLSQHSEKSNPMGEDFNYAKEFNSIDYDALKKDIAAVMTDPERFRGRRICCVISGGNVDPSLYARLITEL